MGSRKLGDGQKASNRRTRADHRADTRGQGWVGIPHVVVDSEAYLQSSIWARAVLIEIARRFHGYNNGAIFISWAELAARLGTTNQRAIGKALGELRDRGFIDVVAAADRLHHKARTYRLTFVSTTEGGHHHPATNDYLSWRTENHSDEASALAPSHTDAASVSKRPITDAALARIAAARGKKPDRLAALTDAASVLIDSHAPGVVAPIGPAPCPACGNPFKRRSGMTASKRFCSEACRKASDRAKRRAKISAAATTPVETAIIIPIRRGKA